MTIGEYLRKNDIDTYRELQKMGKKQKKKKKREIKLGDRPEKLMQHDSYRRIGGKMKQTKWG